MGVAKFTAKDPYAPAATNSELQQLLTRMDGVLDWAISDEGEVAVEYDHELINDQMIEAALSGVGLKLKHVSDEPDLPEPIAQKLLNQEERK